MGVYPARGHRQKDGSIHFGIKPHANSPAPHRALERAVCGLLILRAAAKMRIANPTRDAEQFQARLALITVRVLVEVGLRESRVAVSGDTQKIVCRLEPRSYDKNKINTTT